MLLLAIMDSLSRGNIALAGIRRFRTAIPGYPFVVRPYRKQVDRPMNSFDAQMERVQLAMGTRTQFELADLFGIRQSAISDAKRRGKIPTDWLLFLVREKSINPEWILTGKGPRHILAPRESGRYETSADRLADEEVLRRLPARMLADELVRRIAVLQDKGCSSTSDAPGGNDATGV